MEMSLEVYEIYIIAFRHSVFKEMRMLFIWKNLECQQDKTNTKDP